MFRMIMIIGIVVAVVTVLSHRVLFGAKRVGPGDTNRTVRRFSLWDRFIHLATVAAFLTLATTGLIAVLGQQSPLRGWLWIIHLIAAPAFVLGLTAITLSWAQDGMFAWCDWEWALKCGGYLWGGKHAPAERFNGGQKTYFWTIGLFGIASLVSGLGRIVPVLDPFGQDVLYQIHRYTALLFVMAAIVHLYLGTLANPGTFSAMLTGKVSRAWAESHHPLWWAKINKQDKNQR